MNHLKAGIGSGAFVQYGTRAIGGAVVDTDNLERFVRLCCERIEARAHKALYVIAGYNNRYARKLPNWSHGNSIVPSKLRSGRRGAKKDAKLAEVGCKCYCNTERLTATVALAPAKPGRKRCT